MKKEYKVQATKWANAYYSMLKGFTVTDVVMEENMDFPDGDLWPSLYLTNKKGDHLEIRINQDPEGNGPGHIEYLGGEWPSEKDVEKAPPILWRGENIGDGKIALSAVNIETDEVLAKD